jgi:DNA mismatch repair protein MutS
MSFNIRLLYPSNYPAHTPESFTNIPPGVWRDLGMDIIASAFTSNQEHLRAINKVLSALIQDPEVIQYRQEIIQDLLNNPAMVERTRDLLPVIDSLAHNSFYSGHEMNTLHEVTYRLGELQNIIDCTQGLAEIFQEVHGNLTSAGLINLEAEINRIVHNPTFQSLVDELPELLEKIRTCASVTIGVNLDASLRPVQATLRSINDQPFTDQSLLNRLFGMKKEWEGVAPLHSVPQRAVDGPVALPVSSDLGWAVEPMMVPLFSDLFKILKKTARPIADQLKRFSKLQGSLFVDLRQDLVFYLGAVRFLQRLRDLGLPVCPPEIACSADRICEVRESYNVGLALQRASRSGAKDVAAGIIKNDIHINPEGCMLILTGPNQGGKTTFMQGIGILQVLAQVGCFIPGTEARISPVDRIFTHFPLKEKPSTEMGRLGEEAARLEKIFQQVTQHSMVLLNESLANTSSGESLYLAEDVVKVLLRLGVRAIYSTHLHELANRAVEINASIPGTSKVISMVSSPVNLEIDNAEDEHPRSYKVEARPPMGQSFAREIAVHYGISYEQLEKALEERGLLQKKA